MHVSGIVVCQDNSSSILGAIESFTSQDYPDKSLIVLDNLSGDKSWDMIRNMETHRRLTPCPNQVLQAEERLGAGVVKNFLCEQAMEGFRADIFAFLQPDSRYLPGKLSRSVPYFRDAKVGLVYSDSLKGNPTFGIVRRSFDLELLSRCDIGGNYLISKTALARVGGFDVDTGDDRELIFRLVKHFVPIHHPEPLDHVS